MKKVNFMLTILFMVNNIAAQNVGIGTTTPTASAALEIKSNTKGLLIPVMNTTARNAIATPANGLLVYDSTAKAFYYFKNNGWISMASINALTDADGNTTVEVERTTNDNIIRLKNDGTDHTWFMKNGTNAYNIIHYPILSTDNFLIGTNAGWKLKAGIGGNVFMGARAGYNDSTGTNNTLIGNDAGAGIFTGSKNIAIGNNAGLNLANGSNNVNIGLNAGRASKNNTNSVHIGFLSGYNDSLTTNNIGIGNSSLYSNQGNNNIGIGQGSLMNTTTSGNIAIGVGALELNNGYWGDYGEGLVAIGDSALHNNQYAFGWLPSFNTAIGFKAMIKNRDGYDNTAMGANSLYKNLDGGQNVAIGSGSLSINESGTRNTSIGTFALGNNVNGNNNTAIGANANVATGNLTNATAIGSGALVSVSNAMVLGGNNIKVGIGKSSPTSTLDIVKTTGSVAALTVNGTDNVTNFNLGVNEDIYIRPGKIAGIVSINDASNSRTRIGGVNGGILSKTGINTSNPQSALDVFGDVTITSAGTLGGGLYSTNTSNSQTSAVGLNIIPIGVVSYFYTNVSNGGNGVFSSNNIVGDLRVTESFNTSGVNTSKWNGYIYLDNAITSQYSNIIAVGQPGYFDRNSGPTNYYLMGIGSFITPSLVFSGTTYNFTYAIETQTDGIYTPNRNIAGTVIFYGIK